MRINLLKKPYSLIDATLIVCLLYILNGVTGKIWIQRHLKYDSRMMVYNIKLTLYKVMVNFKGS